MDMGESSEAGTSGGASSEIDYEVFLSYRVADTGQGFTDCLYHAMLDANIRVFLDKEELHVGREIADELPAAIEKSRIYIPIFSKGYASSAWCLRELAHMVECRKSKPSEKEIMPIFYDVGPDDVRLKSNLYVGALDRYEEKNDRPTREECKAALRSVAKIEGWELKEQRYGEFIKSVIREILMKLKIKDKYVTEHLVGMDERVETVLKLLDVYSGGVRFVLIHGMGGIGKTTLAKVVFNKLNSLFSHCCFLGNVRESSSTSFGLINLQKHLLSDALGSGSAFQDRIHDVDDGIKEIEEQLSNKKVFIVFDDVDAKEQLEKLGIKKHVSFGSGSRVILTARNKSVVATDPTLEYELKPLDSVPSLELFSRHAFGRNSPPDDYVGLSRQVVSTTGGLPLALQVMGSLLRPKDKESWIEVLESLREIPLENVHDKLKISYDALSHQQKQIFLDIACLFGDQDKTNAFYMWKDCKFLPNDSISVLVRMSLVKITDDNTFWMDHQLRDLGRNIVRGNMDPRKQSRLWVPETANNIIRTKVRKEAIEAVCLGQGTYTGKEFSRLPNIRFLKLNWGELDGDFESQLKKLRYLSWQGCPQELSAINFHPSNLVVLNVSNSPITEDWAGWNQIKVGKKLKVLDLTYCTRMTRTPNFSGYLSLERLILKDCTSLVVVDGSFEKFKCLIYFNANGCISLRELPEEIGGLEKLEYLYLGNCKKLRKLPESFARMTSLIELDLSYTAITRLPDSIGNQKRLLVLKLQGTQINRLPSSVENLQELKSLFLSQASIEELPLSIGMLKSLVELDVSATNFLRLPESIGNLSRLKVLNLASSLIRELPRSIVELKELEELHAEHCQHLEWEIPEGISELSLLRVLNLEFTLIRNVPETIQLLPHLEKLGLCDCSKLKALPKLPTSLISLSFGSSSLQRVEDLSNLTKLAELRYRGGHDENFHPLFSQDGPSRQSLAFLQPFLSTLSLQFHESRASLSFGCNLRNLTCLSIYRCCWKEVQLDGLGQLIEFEVEGLEFLEGFAGLSSLKRLKLLRLIDCANLTTIEGLDLLESLEQLDVSKCPGIGCLCLWDLKKLKSLKIRECEELQEVKGLDELLTLTNLELTRCMSLSNVYNSKLPGECSLTILSCPNFSPDMIQSRVSMNKQRIVWEQRRKRKL